MELREWQREALDAWNLKGCLGTITASTGSGKTLLAIEAMKEIKGKIIVIVPTIQLQRQWKSEIIKHIGEEPGLIGGGFDKSDRITVCVVNSIRDKNTYCELVILDECHRYFSEENLKAIEKCRYRKGIAISATPERTDEMHQELFERFPKIFTIELDECIKEGYLCNYESVKVPVELTPHEEKKLEKLNRFIDDYLPLFNYDLSVVFQEVKQKNFQAMKLIGNISSRKSLLVKSTEKKRKAKELILKHKRDKIMVFCEYTTVADQLYRSVEKIMPAFKYHSKMKLDEKEEALEQFRESVNGVLLTAKALDEGTDVPDCNVGIIVSGNSTKRQNVQRFGRVLRQREGKVAKLYSLYVKGTQDEKWVKQRMN